MCNITIKRKEPEDILSKYIHSISHMKFNLEYYRAFFMVANLLSFTKAADYLCLTQPAVSHSVRKLEEELGCKLFDRTPSGLLLTKEGMILYRYVKKAFEELQTGEHLITKYAEFKSGTLQIGATETSLRFFLAPQIKKFKEKFPDIHITFTGSTTRNTCQKLHNKEIEIAFLFSPIPTDYHFQLLKIGEVQDIPVSSSCFPIEPNRIYSIKELSEYPFIYVTSDNSVRTHIDTWFIENNVLFRPEYTVASTGLIMPLIENHLGIGIIPEIFVKKEIENGKFIQIKTESLPPPRTLYLATNPSIPVSAICKEFIQFISETGDFCF